MSLVSWRMVSAVWLCVMMTSLAADIEPNDELSPEDLSYMYQDYSYGGVPADLKDESGLRRFLLNKWPTKDHYISPNELPRPKWMSPNTVLVPPETFDLSLLKRSMMKRVLEASGVLPKVRDNMKQLVQKWKIKKGKAGSQMICYFKLCAFRPPS